MSKENIRTCTMCSTEFEITTSDLEFYEKISPIFQNTKKNNKIGGNSIKELGNGYFKYLIQTPKLCPNCRHKRRLTFRNERKLYKRVCDATGKPIISIYSPDKPYKVYDNDYWWSDKWNSHDYSIIYDDKKDFLNQFEELMLIVPKFATYKDVSMENSDYTNYGKNCKNLYLCFNSYGLTNSYYSTSCFSLLHEQEENNIDCEDCTDSSDIYYCTDLRNSKSCFFSSNLIDCYNCNYCNDLIGCNYCIFSCNQNNKKYLVLNNQVSKDEYFRIKDKIIEDNYFRNEMELKFNELKQKTPKKSSNNIGSEDVTGEFILNSKNVYESFLVGSVENGKFLYTSGYHSKNMYDGMNSGDHSNLTYETMHTHKTNKSGFLIDVDNCNNTYYSFQCYNSSNLFGCIGLVNKSYCILNKQYCKEEYEKYVPEIIENMIRAGVWGEFFPSYISPFGYNETVAQEYFSIKKEDIISNKIKQSNNSDITSKTNQSSEYGKGRKTIFPRSPHFIHNNKKETFIHGILFNWSDYESPFPKVEKVIPANMLPNNIADIPNDILNWAIECEVTKKPFKIIAQELDFYRKHDLSIPKRSPDQRHIDRIKKRNPKKLFSSFCDKCKSAIKTTYSPDNPEIIYCDKCYLKE